MEWLLEFVLVLLLGLTLFHAVRLERALGVLQRDRAALEELVGRFNSSTRQAEQGVEHLRNAAEGAGRHIARQVEIAAGLKDDLVFLVDRGERLADRLDGLVRTARSLAPEGSRSEWRSTDFPAADHVPLAVAPANAMAEPPPRMRSQAERDLLNALRAVR